MGHTATQRADPSGGVLIDLGADRDWPADDGPPPAGRARRGAAVPLVVALLVLLVVAASGPPPAAALRPLFQLAAAPDDTFTVLGDTLLVVRPSAGSLEAYAVDTGRPRWQARVAPPASYAVRASGDLLLVSERDVGGGPHTVAVAAGSGEVLWRRAGRVVSVGGAPVVLGVSEVRGVVGVSRRVQGRIVGLDPRTGRARWTVPVPFTALMQPVGGASPRLLLVHDTGLIELRDLADGRALATSRLPAAEYTPENPGAAGRAVLLRHPSPAGAVVTAYDRDSLGLRWSRAEPAVANQRTDVVRACGALACLTGRSGVLAVEPDGGAQRWFRPGWRSVEQRGPYLLAYGSGTGAADLVALADPRTGRILLDLRRWRVVSSTTAPDLLLSRPDGPQGRTVVALADPGRAALRVLGTLPAGATDCRGGSGRLVCRLLEGGLLGWSYRSGDRA